MDCPRTGSLYEILFTPYEGLTLKGKAVMTIVDGEIVMKEGKVLK